MALQFFPEKFERGLLTKIIEIARATAHPADRTRVFVSQKAYSDAFAEADFDAAFLKARRGLHNGVSEGKIAGILFFRFSRHRIIALVPDIIDHPDYEHFQEKIVIRIIGSLMHVDFNDPWIANLAGTMRPGGLRYNFQKIYGELMYLTCRRHYNQESLALFFDTCAYLSHAIAEIRRLESAPPAP